MLFNIVIFGIVIFVFVRHTMGVMSRRNQKLDRATTLRLIISISGIMTLFGLTWIFGAFTVADASFAFQLIFAILNTFQGFYIFVFFVVLSKDARESWMTVLSGGRYQPGEGTTHGKYSTGDARSKKVATGSTGLSSTVHSSSKATATTHSGYEMPEVKKVDLEKTDTETGVSTFQRESPQLEERAERVEAPVLHAMPMVAKKEEDVDNKDDGGTPIRARVQRYTTKYVGKHHVEEYEVDFEDDIEEEDKPAIV